MDSWITKGSTKIVQVLKGRSNSYLITKNGKAILVDTGKTNAWKSLQQNIEKLELPNINISHLLLTHTHYDHCQSVNALINKYNCKVIVSGKAVQSIENGYTILPRGTFFVTKLVSKLGRMFGKVKFGYRPFLPDILFNSEISISIDPFNIKIIETSGHSEDSISLIVDDEIALVGDAMFGILKKSIFLPYADCPTKMVESWGELLNTGCDIFLPGHGREINRHLLEKEYRKYAPRYQ